MNNVTAPLVVAGAVALVSIVQLLVTLASRRIVPLLSTVTSPEAAPSGAPRVSLIAAARNEAETMPAAAATWLAQDYPNLQIVIVNDRSTDATGSVAARLVEAHRNVHVITVDELPPGWLGKNHALWRGAQTATGDWLLFTDADVHFDPTLVRRAMAYAQQHQLDHLTLVPRLAGVHNYWLEAWVNFFTMAFLAYKRPDQANNPRSRIGMGVGAFNLLRREAYERMGTFAAISLRPDDDLRLGQRVKRLGMRQNLLIGAPLLAVAWYRTLGEAVRGLEKNTFAGLNYSAGMVVVAIAGLVGLLVWPFAALFVVRGVPWWLYALAVAAQLATYIASNEWRGARSLQLALSYPLSALLFTYTIARSAWLTLRQGGIRWRETFYPLALLKSQSGLPDETP